MGTRPNNLHIYLQIRLICHELLFLISGCSTLLPCQTNHVKKIELNESAMYQKCGDGNGSDSDVILQDLLVNYRDLHS